MNSRNERHATDVPATRRADAPSHPHLQATLLMLGVVVFLVVVAALEVL